MPEPGHKGDFPSREDIRDFLASLRGEPGAMFKALDGVAHGTVEKWYRDKDKGGTEISATNLLRVVLSLEAVPQFTEWLASYSPVGETGHAPAPPVTAEEHEAFAKEMAETQARKSAKEAGRGRGRQVGGAGR